MKIMIFYNSFFYITIFCAKLYLTVYSNQTVSDDIILKNSTYDDTVQCDCINKSKRMMSSEEDYAYECRREELKNIQNFIKMNYHNSQYHNLMQKNKNMNNMSINNNIMPKKNQTPNSIEKSDISCKNDSSIMNYLRLMNDFKEVEKKLNDINKKHNNSIIKTELINIKSKIKILQIKILDMENQKILKNKSSITEIDLMKCLNIHNYIIDLLSKYEIKSYEKFHEEFEAMKLIIFQENSLTKVKNAYSKMSMIIESVIYPIIDIILNILDFEKSDSSKYQNKVKNIILSEYEFNIDLNIDDTVHEIVKYCDNATILIELLNIRLSDFKESDFQSFLMEVYNEKKRINIVSYMNVQQSALENDTNLEKQKIISNQVISQCDKAICNENNNSSMRKIKDSDYFTNENNCKIQCQKSNCNCIELLQNDSIKKNAICALYSLNSEYVLQNIQSKKRNLDSLLEQDNIFMLQQLKKIAECRTLKPDLGISDFGESSATLNICKEKQFFIDNQTDEREINSNYQFKKNIHDINEIKKSHDQSNIKIFPCENECCKKKFNQLDKDTLEPIKSNNVETINKDQKRKSKKNIIIYSGILFVITGVCSVVAFILKSAIFD